jgi:LuxR family transcriptional regulator, maltose regulon positive regulatory protein
MSMPILATKLYIPPARPKVVLRPRLIERLNEGLASGGRLTLISAPAGFGKTTLVSEWLSACDRQAAWLSLDEGDNDPTLFLVYLVSALQTLALRSPRRGSEVEGIAASVGAGVLAALQSPQSAPPELLLTTLLNDLATLPDHFILVLDDYHVIDAQPVDHALAFLVEHLPPQMHLVIATREDPPLSLARLRARGQLTELRAADLRFTPAEAAEFLNRVMGLNLSAEDIAALETRTEGWIAGLQLAALSMEGRSDMVRFIRGFAGSHRYVLDYLVEEVLQRQPEAIHSFLLKTAILDRLSGSLCDAVTGREDGKGMLETLERSNLFIVPLDDQRQWYRYHRLFAEVLQARLLEEHSVQVPGLHRRASAWCQQNSMQPEAIRHALAAEDFERAAGLLELAWSAMDINYQSAAWLSWVKALPDQVIRTRPVLSVGYAWALLDGGELEACESRLQDAERWLETPSNEGIVGDKMIVTDRNLFQSLPATIATARAYRALALGDVSGTVQYARQALEQIPEQDQIRRIQATALLGLAQHASGDLDAAERSFTDLQANLHKAGDIATATGITFVLANIKIARGRLREAVSDYRQTMRLVAGQGETMPVGTADLYRGIGELYCEQGELEAAANNLLTAKKLGAQAAPTDWQHRLYVAEARIQEAQGNLDGALDLINEAERLYVRGPLPNVRPIAALRARVWIRQGKLTEAQGWARDQSLSPDDELSYLREFEHVTLARLLIARYKTDRSNGSIHEAARLLGRLLQAAEAGGRVGSVIEILVLQALGHEAQGDISLALVSLERALMLAEPEGYVRIFVDEGLAMAALLGRMKMESGRMKGYVHKLLAAFGKQQEVRSSSSVLHPLVEPLSDRELEVLKLLATELSGPEIAHQLIVSLNTLRTHTKSIFNKLGVNNRRAAVRRAEELLLL